jgi:hypothetical protein
MLHAIPANDLLELGEQLWSVASPPSALAKDDLFHLIDSFIASVKKNHVPHSLAATKSLQDLKKAVDAKGTLICDTEQLKTIMGPIRASIIDELNKQDIIVLKTGEVSAQLRQWEAKTVDDTQKLLLSETIRCIEAHPTNAYCLVEGMLLRVPLLCFACEPWCYFVQTCAKVQSGFINGLFVRLGPEVEMVTRSTALEALERVATKVCREGAVFSLL